VEGGRADAHGGPSPMKKNDICINAHAHGRLAPSDKGSQNKVNKRKPKRNFSVF